MKKPTQVFKLKTLALACAMTVPAAYAPQLFAAEGFENLIEEVIVTSRKREESIQDVPITVSVFGQEALERAGVVALTDLGRMVPNMQIHSGGPGSGSGIKLRGIGTSTISAAFDPAVALNIDGVVLASHRLIVAGQMDMRQIEVLKGPQSLYFGKSATSGVISILSNDPGEEFEMMLRGEYAAEHEGKRTEAMISGPITDTLGARLAIALGETDKIRENLNPDVTNKNRGDERTDARLTLVWDPVDNFSAKLKTSYSSYEDDGPNTAYNLNCPEGQQQQTFLPEFGIVLPAGHYDCQLNEKIGAPDVWPTIMPDPSYKTFSSWNNGVPYSEQESLLSSLQLDWDINDQLSLTSITAHLDLENNSVGGYDYALGLGGSQAFNSYKSISQELRLESTFDSALNFSAGLYYADIDQVFTSGQNAVNLGFVGFSDPITGNNYSWDKEHYLNTKSGSAFAALYWDISEDLELTVGARYTDDKKVGEIRFPYMHFGLSGGDGSGGFLPSGTVITDGLQFQDSSVNPEAALNWHISDEISMYLAYKTGYKAGGIDNSALPSGTLALGDVSGLKYESENSEGFELGFKSTLMDGTLRANASIYQYVYENLQNQQFNPAEVQFVTFNAGEITTKGIEADVYWMTPVEGLTMHAAIALTDAQYTASTIIVTGNDVNGEDVNGSADLAGNIGASYQGSITNDLMWAVSGDARYNGGFKLGGSLKQDSYLLYDASVSVFTEDNKYELSLVGRNLSNEFYAHTMAGRPFSCQTGATPGTCAPVNTVGLDSLAHTNQGREYTLRFTYRY